jgi:hypothetical protein
MTEESSVSIDEVRALVAERRRFDEWLSALEERRDETPEHVYERVHGDYLARRSEVMTQLHAHVPDLETLVAELDERAQSLAVRSQAEDDEKAEAMLRHAVGEYDDDKWNEVRQRVESTLATLGGESEALELQRDDVRSLLESARPESEPEPEPEPEPVAVADAQVEVVEATNAETSATADWLGAMTPTDVESQDGTTETSSEGAAERTEGVSASDQDEEVSGETRTDRDDESGAGPLADVDGLELTSDAGDRPAPSAPERTSIWGRGTGGDRERDGQSDDTESSDVFGGARSNRETPARTDGISGKDPSKEASKEDPSREESKPSDGFDELAFLRSVIEPEGNQPMVPRPPASGDAQKTLRCTECGTMNLPTEWYCERCGSELASF